MLTLSKTKGIGGSIKRSPEDFVVREIESNGLILEEGKRYNAADLGETEEANGEFTKFILQKRDWDTIHALVTMAKNLSRGKKSIGYYGSKDRLSVSVQLASIYGVEPDQVMQIRMKDVSINGAWKSAKPVELGSNIGNSFSTVIRDCSNTARIEEIAEELDGVMPNYYDRQRFGIRMNNAEIGMCMIRGDFENAVMKFLTDTQFETNKAAVEARKRLKEEMDFKTAREYFPKSLRNEKMVIEYMSQYNNHANALRKIPRGLLVMFIHSVQSMIFNAALEKRISEEDLKSKIKCGKNFYGFPDVEKMGKTGDFAAMNLIGYESKALDDYEEEILEKVGLKTEDFKIKSMPELSMKGSYRTLLSPVKDLSYEAEESSARVDFSIPAGSYATILLNEITKSDSFNLQLPSIE